MSAITYRRSIGSAGFDADALAYWNATQLSRAMTYYPGTAYEITGLAMLRAVDRFVKALKAAGIWAKGLARYPMLGGSEFAHQFNLMRPTLASDSFVLSFSNAPPHSATGVAFNGIDQSAKCNFENIGMLDSFDNALLYYAASAAQDPNRGGQAVMGDANSAQSEILLAPNRGDLLLYAAPDDPSLAIASGQPPSKGVFIGSRTSANYATVFLNGVKKAQSTVTATGNFGSPDIQLGRGGSGTYSLIPCQGAAILRGLTDSQAMLESNAWLQLNTTLKRA